MTDYQETIDALKQGTESHPDLAETVDLYCALLTIQEQADAPAPETNLTAEAARARLEQGEPLLTPEEIVIDASKLTDLAMQLAFAIAECRRERVRELADIHAWLHKRRDKMAAVATAYLRDGYIREGNGNVDPGLLVFVLHSALQPVLRAQARPLARFVEASTWYRGYCPICGGQPDMAALERSGGRRRLLCSRCDSEWSYRRLGCPFCGNDEPKDLGFFPSEDNVYRLAVCERCHRYLKTVDLREVPAERPLTAERVLTAAMDVTAQREGYRATDPIS